MRKGTVKLKGSEIVRRREAKGWSQKRLSDKAGCDGRSVQRAESGQPLLLKIANEIATALSCTIDDLRELESVTNFRTTHKLTKAVTLLSTKAYLHSHVNRLDLANTAKEIDMLGWNLNANWFQNDTFVIALEERLIKKNLRLRVLLPNVSSKFMDAVFLDRRSFVCDDALAEIEIEAFRDRHSRSIENIKLLRKHTNVDVLRLLDKQLVCCGIVRFDKIMILTVYTYPHRGDSHSVLLIWNNPELKDETVKDAGVLFEKYKGIFNQLWEKGVSLKEIKPE